MASDRMKGLTYSCQMKGGNSRLKEMILYIADKCAEDPTFGAVKLNKILFYADFRSFERYGEPVTGETYQRLPMGPAPVALKIVEREMQEAGDAIVRDNPYGGKVQKRTHALREADLNLFSARDIAIVDAVISELWGQTATTVSNGSHGRAWKTRNDGDRIPYEAAYLSNEPITAADVDRTRKLVLEGRIDVQATGTH